VTAGQPDQSRPDNGTMASSASQKLSPPTDPPTAPVPRRRPTASAGRSDAAAAAAAAGMAFEAPHRRQQETRLTRLAGVIAGRSWRTMSWVAGHLPPGPVYRIGGWLAMIGYATAPTRRRWLRANMGHVLGTPPSDPRAGRLARAAYRNYSRYVLEVMRQPWLTKQQAMDMVEIAGEAPLVQAHRDGRGIILVSGHTGNNEAAAGGFASLGMTIDVVGDDTAFGPLYELFERQRGRFGLRMISWRNLRAMYSSLHKGSGLVLLVDWGYRPDGIPVRMFGSWTTLPAGPAILAARFRVPIMPFKVKRLPDGRFLAVGGRTIEVASDSPADLARATQAIAGALEQQIAEVPEQWYIFKPIWPGSAEEERRLAAAAGELLGSEGPASNQAATTPAPVKPAPVKPAASARSQHQAR
jgi:lauroyl/myristoyl acyltransferase